MNDEQRRALDKVIARVGDLPALPDIVTQALQTTEDPSATMAQISNCIQRDPALTAKILKVSNSPYYGMKQYVGTLKLALVILGVSEIRNIVLGVSVFDTLTTRQIDKLVVQNLWDHSVMVGGLSKKLGGTLALGLQGEDFISGLLHDVGKMVLLRHLGTAYLNVFRKSGGCGELLCALEMNTWGFDHADTAAALATYWNLPQTLTDALWCHHPSAHRPLHQAKDPRLAALVRITNVAAREDWSDSNGSPHASCADDEAWNVLETAHGLIPVDKRHRLLAGFLDEFNAPPEKDKQNNE